VVVMFASGVNDDEVGQQTLQVQPQMGFGGCFASPVLGPSIQLGIILGHDMTP
jgi:hypothetical protein